MCVSYENDCFNTGQVIHHISTSPNGSVECIPAHQNIWQVERRAAYKPSNINNSICLWRRDVFVLQSLTKLLTTGCDTALFDWQSSLFRYAPLLSISKTLNTAGTFNTKKIWEIFPSTARFLETGREKSRMAHRKTRHFTTLGAFAKLQKANISSDMSVRLPARNNSTSTGRNFTEFDLWVSIEACLESSV